MDIAVAVRLGEPLAVLAGVVEVASVLDDLRTERTHRVQLRRVRVLRDADHHPDAEPAAGERHRLAVVPGRGGDDPALTLVGREPETRFTPPRTLNAPVGR